MTDATVLPKDLKPGDFQRYDPKGFGGDVAYGFVPSKPYVHPDSREATTKVRLNIEMDKFYKVFFEGSAEDLIDHIILHENIILDVKVKSKIKNFTDQMDHLKSERKTLSIDRVTNVVRIEEISVSLTKMKGSIDTLNNNAFDYMEKLLCGNRAEIWRDIVKVECESTDYVTLKGKAGPNPVRGKVLASLSPCYFRLMRTLVGYEAAEIERRFMTTNLLLNLDKGINVQQGICRFKQMNKKLKYLPCMKHKEGSPDALVAYNKPFSDMELCQHILFALPKRICLEYHVTTSNEFPIDVRVLQEHLVRVCARQKEQKKQLKDFATKLGLSQNSPGNPNKKVRMALEADTIPKKERARGSARGGHAMRTQEDGGAKTCKLCKKFNTWNPKAYLTHSTDQCRKFDKDGKIKSGKSGGAASKGAERRQHFAQQKKVERQDKKLKKYKKKYRKEKKRRKKRKATQKGGYYNSSSSSDSSSSDSE